MRFMSCVSASINSSASDSDLASEQTSSPKANPTYSYTVLVCIIMHIYIYIHICVCVCICNYAKDIYAYIYILYMPPNHGFVVLDVLTGTQIHSGMLHRGPEGCSFSFSYHLNPRSRIADSRLPFGFLGHIRWELTCRNSTIKQLTNSRTISSRGISTLWCGDTVSVLCAPHIVGITSVPGPWDSPISSSIRQSINQSINQSTNEQFICIGGISTESIAC